MAITSQGLIFIWTDGTAAVTSGMDSTGSVGEITSISGPGGGAAILDVTNLLSAAKEKLPGLPDEGQLTMELNFNYNTSLNMKQKALIDDRKSRTKRAWGILYPDASSSLAKADGYVTNFSVSGGVDAPLKANVTIEIDGPVTWTT